MDGFFSVMVVLPWAMVIVDFYMYRWLRREQDRLITEQREYISQLEAFRDRMLQEAAE